MRTNLVAAICCTAPVLYAGLAIVPAGAESEKHWPYLQTSSTPFARVIGPHSSDVHFIINGRPIGFDKLDKDMHIDDLQKQIKDVLKQAEETDRSNGNPVAVSTEPIIYLKNIKQALANLGNPRLRLEVMGDFVEIIYTPPYERLGDMDIRLYDALSAICARQRDFPAAYQNMAKSLERKIVVYGAQSDEVAQQLIDIAALNEDTHNYNAADKYYKQAYEIIKATHGEHSKDAAAVLMQLSHALNSAGRTKESEQAGEQAIAIMNSLHISHVGYGLPMRASHHWSAETMVVTSIISALEQDTSRRRADVEGMRRTLHDLVHEDEIRRQRELDRIRKEAEEARGAKIREQNEKLLGSSLQLASTEFKNKNSSLSGALSFPNGSDVDITPDYATLDGKTVPRSVVGHYQVSPVDEGDHPTWSVRITSQYDGTERSDKWLLLPSSKNVGEVELVPSKVEKPYPEFLIGRIKIKKAAKESEDEKP